MKPKRVVVVSDFHSGHIFGLTPPGWFDKALGAEARTIYWNFYRTEVKSLQPIDVLIVNGDCIDGKGDKSGGTEQLTADRERQIEIAGECIEAAGARKVFMSYGTAYHTGDGEDWESVLARDIGADKIGSHDALSVNGLVIDYRHHIGGSGVPHGRTTALARERLWNLLWAEFSEYPKADVIIRSHVHYHAFAGGSNWLAMTTPALQGPGSKYGARRCSGTVDFGLVSFDIASKESYQWQAHILKRRTSGYHLLKA